jgi:hypothetical protein
MKLRTVDNCGAKLRNCILSSIVHTFFKRKLLSKLPAHTWKVPEKLFFSTLNNCKFKVRTILNKIR